MIDLKELDFNQPFNAGASMRMLGLPECSCPYTDDAERAVFIEGWRWQESQSGSHPILWVAIDEVYTTPEFRAGWKAYQERKDTPPMSIEQLRLWHKGWEAAREVNKMSSRGE